MGYLNRIFAMALAVALICAGMPLMAQTENPPDTSQSAQQLDTLVAPIALYPDPLISQILVASTYPLELVQANQWLQQHPELQGEALKDAAAQQNWDPSVQALVLFPDVIKRLNADVTWTTNLGNAFLANQGNVMDAIQRMRVTAEQSGKLKSTPQEEVTTTNQSGQPAVEIEPADPAVIYVPVYNPVWIWGPPMYDYYPAWYYPPPLLGVWFLWGPAFTMSLFYPGWIGFGGWGWWGWHPGWGNHTVIVNRSFMNSNHYRAGNLRGNVWEHNPAHRMGVAYSNRAVAQRFNAAGAQRPGFARPTVGQVQQQLHQRAMSSGVTSERIGNRSIMSNSTARGRSAFGSIEHGSDARAYSSRGRSSLGRMAGGKGGILGSRGRR